MAVAEVSEGDTRPMRPRRLPGRRGGPALSTFLDVIAHATHTRSWLILAVIVITVVAMVVAAVGQAVVPWAIYPAM